MSSNLFASTLTDVYFLNTNARRGVVLMPSTIQNIGRFLTFKDITGRLSTNTITFSTIHSTQRFEDNTSTQTYNDRFGAYTFVADSNKWYLVGGSRMNNAVISTVNTSTLNIISLSTLQVNASTITLPNSNNVYSRNNILYYGSNLWNQGNAWGGARTAIPLYLPVGRTYQTIGRLALAGSNLGVVTTVQQGANTWTVHTFNNFFPGNYDFTVTSPGLVEIIMVGVGGRGGSGTAFTTLAGGAVPFGGGGGGSGSVFNTTGRPIYLGVGTYQINNRGGAVTNVEFLSVNSSTPITLIMTPGTDGEVGTSNFFGTPKAGDGGGATGAGLKLITNLNPSLYDPVAINTVYSGGGGNLGQGGAGTATGGGGAGIGLGPPVWNATAGSNGELANSAQAATAGRGGGGRVIPDWLSAIGGTRVVGGGGGGGGAGGSTTPAVGGGLGGQGGLLLGTGTNGGFPGGGGGGAGGRQIVNETSTGGSPGNGQIQIRYTIFSTIYTPFSTFLNRP